MEKSKRRSQKTKPKDEAGSRKSKVLNRPAKSDLIS